MAFPGRPSNSAEGWFGADLAIVASSEVELAGAEDAFHYEHTAFTERFVRSVTSAPVSHRS
jgi:hypothetical protein